MMKFYAIYVSFKSQVLFLFVKPNIDHSYMLCLFIWLTCGVKSYIKVTFEVLVSFYGLNVPFFYLSGIIKINKFFKPLHEGL